MASSDVQRKLTAILVADVVGYSRLMGADEEATIETLTDYRKVFISEIKNHHGRVVDAKGDALMAEFASVVDAVNGAVEIQRELAQRNTALSDDRRMDFRIGINLGDVVVQDDVIYGDGVNVAARLESLAEPGGICVSRPVYDQVETKLDLDWKYLGEQQVKNIARPVRAYTIGRDSSHGGANSVHPRPDAEEAGKPEATPQGLHDQPSLAVLPFANMSGDPEQEYFSDGLTEDIITDLSQLPRLLVIARNSVFVYKNKPTDVRQVGRELGVQYVLEGSVRKAGNRVRITAQLASAATGDHLWARRYDREMQDIFALQDEITRDIAAELEVKLLEGEQARVWHRLTDNAEAYDLALRGRDLFRRYIRADVLRGRQLLEKALELDPGFSYAMAELGWTYVVEGNLESGEAVDTCFDRAIEYGNRAIELDDTLGEAYTLLAAALRYKGDHDKAVEYGFRAVALNPDDADANLGLSQILTRMDRGQEALERIEVALRLNPNPPGSYFGALGSAYRAVGRLDEAIAALRKCLERLPDHIRAHIGLTHTYMEAGREEEGRNQARQVLRINPNFSSSAHPYVASFQDPAKRGIIETLLRKAGLPE